MVRPTHSHRGKGLVIKNCNCGSKKHHKFLKDVLIPEEAMDAVDEFLHDKSFSELLDMGIEKQEEFAARQKKIMMLAGKFEEAGGYEVAIRRMQNLPARPKATRIGGLLPWIFKFLINIPINVVTSSLTATKFFWHIAFGCPISSLSKCGYAADLRTNLTNCVNRDHTHTCAFCSKVHKFRKDCPVCVNMYISIKCPNCDEPMSKIGVTKCRVCHGNGFICTSYNGNTFKDYEAADEYFEERFGSSIEEWEIGRILEEGS